MPAEPNCVFLSVTKGTRVAYVTAAKSVSVSAHQAVNELTFLHGRVLVCVARLIEGQQRVNEWLCESPSATRGELFANRLLPLLLYGIVHKCQGNDTRREEELM